MFGIDDEEWENLDSDYPTRHIKSISTVVEVSAVTFPAYEETSISARDKSAVETARIAVETARSGEVDTSSNKLKLEKLKIKYLLGGILKIEKFLQKLIEKEKNKELKEKKKK